MAGDSAPKAPSCPHMLHGSRASQPPAKALKGTREATFSPKDAPRAQLERIRRNGTPVPRCQAGSCQWEPESLGETGCSAACWLWDAPSQAQQSSQLSGTRCLRLPSCGHLPLLLCGLPILPTFLHVPPFSLQIPLAKGDADQPSDRLWKDPTLQPVFSDASAWCIQKKKVAQFKVCQYSMNKLEKN